MLLTGLGLAAAPSAPPPFIMLEGSKVHPTSVMVKYGPRTSSVDAANAATAAGLRLVREFSGGWAVLDLPPQAARPAAGQAVQALQARFHQLRQSGRFEVVEPDYIRELTLSPADNFFLDGTLWGLHNTGQAGGLRGADIGVTNAWDITVGSTNVIVAVLDSGIRYTHQDLAAQMWRNPGEIAGDSIDNDGNGIVDDVFGFNAITGSGDPNDDFGHGTHVAGIIGAVANNGHPHVGVAWNVRLMALKVTDQNNNLSSSAIVAAVGYARTNGAKIINCSVGGFSLSTAEQTAFAQARAAGILVVAAAGNFGAPSDFFPFYPAGYHFSPPGFQLDNIISVGAMDRSDGYALFSNYGSNSVHLGAPGVQITSTYYLGDNSYASLDGTSMAAAHVSGIAALVFSLTNTMTYSEVRNRILFTTTPVPALAGITSTGGRVNAYRALTTAGDNQLEVQLNPPPGSTLLAGSTVAFTVAVSDLMPVNNAAVLGSIPGVFTNLFLNNGAAPDLVAGDNRHTLNVTLPTVTSNVTMTLQVTAPGKTNLTGTFAYRIATVPPNDTFPPIAKVPDNGGTVTGDNTFGTTQFGEPVHAGVLTVANSVWWNFAPTNTTQVLVDTAGSTFDTVVAVYTGNSLTNLVPLAATNDVTTSSGTIQQGFLYFNATNGVTYRIVVAAASTNSVGQVRLRVLPGGFADTNAPVVVITNLVSGPLSVTNPPSGLIVTNAALTLSGRALDPTADAVGVSQVIIRLNNGLSATALGTNDWTIPLFLTPGTNVIQVIALDYSGNVSVPLPFQVIYRVFDPFNDVLANALELTGVFGGATTNNANATLEPGEPLHAGKQGGKSVWYFFTPPADGVFSLTTSNSSFDTLLAAYTGTRVDRLTVVSANDDTPSGAGVHSDVTLAVRGGIRYYVAVDGLSGASGQLFLTYSFTAVPLFSLSVTPGPNGVVFPNSGVYASNTVVDVTAVANIGFNFVTWTGDVLSLDNPLRLPIIRNTTLAAVFAPVPLADHFEAGGFRPGIGWATNNAAGVAPWFVQAAGGLATNSPFGGSFHARSGAITHNQATVLRLTANCRAGNAAFLFRVSSEEFGTTGDFFEFYLNSVRQLRLNGESGWQTHAFAIPAGTNTLEWRYIKDASSSSTVDAAFLDNVDLPLVEPVNLAVPVQIDTGAIQQVNGGLQLRIQGQTNQTYLVQASADLANWVTVSTNLAPYGLIQFSEPQALTNSSRYYRVILP